MILLIEDDDATRDTTARILRLAGHVVITAADGREALAILERELPAVILCDLNMPGVDGRTFRRLQQASPVIAAIPFVIVSASFDLDEEAAALAADMTLRKPVDVDDLVRCASAFDDPADVMSVRRIGGPGRSRA